MLDVETVDAIAREIFPARSDIASLEYVEALVDGGFVMLVIRLVLWREREGNLEISDVKEQRVRFASAAEPTERFTAYLAAWVEVLSKVFENRDYSWETMMPHDLVHPGVLSLKRAQTQADFAVAFSQRSRLGRALPEGALAPAKPPRENAPPRSPPPPPPEPDESL